MTTEDRLNADRSWYEYRQLVLNELQRLTNAIVQAGERIDDNYQKINDEMTRMKVDIAMLQIKSGVWGAVAGVIVTLGAVLLQMLKRG